MKLKKKSITSSVSHTVTRSLSAVDEAVSSAHMTLELLNINLTEMVIEARLEAIDNLVSNYGYTKAKAEAIINSSKGV